MDSIDKLIRDDSEKLTTKTDKRTAELADEYDIIEHGNCYVDLLLETLIASIETGFDPYCLEDYVLTTPFAKAGLCNGYVTGLQSLHRTGDCFLTKTYRRLHMNADVGATDVNIVYEVTLEMKSLTLKFTLNLHFGRIRIETNFSFFENSGRDATMHQFDIKDLDNMVPSITIYKPLDWFFNKVVQATVWFLNAPIKKALSNVIKRRIEHGLPCYQFPSVVVGRTSPPLDKSSETTRNSRYNGLYSQGGSVKSLTDSNAPSVISESGFLASLDEYRRLRSRCEDSVIDEITPELALQLAKEEFQRRKPSYDILN